MLKIRLLGRALILCAAAVAGILLWTYETHHTLRSGAEEGFSS